MLLALFACDAVVGFDMSSVGTVERALERRLAANQIRGKRGPARTVRADNGKTPTRLEERSSDRLRRLAVLVGRQQT